MWIRHHLQQPLPHGIRIVGMAWTQVLYRNPPCEWIAVPGQPEQIIYLLSRRAGRTRRDPEPRSASNMVILAHERNLQDHLAQKSVDGRPGFVPGRRWTLRLALSKHGLD